MRPVLLLAIFTVPASAGVDFVREVRPLFEKHCYECHGARKQKNGLRLDVKQAALHGGDEHAPDIVAGRSADSPLFRFVSGSDRDVRMPPKEKTALSVAEVAVLKEWIDEGAVWPDGVDVAKLEDKTDWWSFKPLKPGAWDKAQGVDDFIRAKLAEKGLKPAPPADPLTLIRRLYFDLTGLPPTPEEVARFERETKDWEMRDKKPAGTAANAKASGTTSSGLSSSASPYERLVDSLLASPRYGERWARHWLDVAHYGETHGYDKDKPRPNAWPYRDYVIRALNDDKPYTRFVEEQIAGDAMYPGTSDGVTALGFIAAGPWDYIGHAEVPETKIDGKIARHLDRDDMVQNTIGAFCSLTIGCAQCHNHKFDPITQEDYYSLQAVFAAIDRTDVNYYPDDAAMRRFVKLDTQRKESAAAISALEEPLKKKAGEKFVALSRRIDGAADKGAKNNPNAKPDFGWHSAISPVQDVMKWVQVDLGKSVEIQRIVLKPCYDDYGGIGGGFGFPVRFKIEASDDPEFKTGVTLLWRKHDATFMNDFKNPGLTPFETNTAGDDGVRGRHVRITAVKLAPRKGDFIFALSELEVFGCKTGPNLAAGRPVTSLDSIEAPPRWRRMNLTDGIAPEPRTQEDKRQLIRERDALMLAQADAATRAKLDDARRQRTAIEAEIAKLPAPGKVYAGAVHTGAGAFRGTGHEGGKPRVIAVLKRGDVKNPGKEAAPSAIRALSELAHVEAAFPNTGPEAQRRAALARWITAKDNPLTWRSIVNRVWQHHFGRPLVDTPNDFGRMGALPTHPELLDWLAVAFRDDMGGSLKKLHKLLVMSEVYRQTSASSALADKSDVSNQWLSHQNRRKLDAEAVRDSILAVSGKLDFTMGGPGFQDFVITHPEHSPHYEYELHDPDDPNSWRRSIYRFIVRSQQQPFMTVMDCADPSMRVDKRNESISPLQALAMMNNGLTVAMAKHFAERAAKNVAGIEAQTRRAFEFALSRPPDAAEVTPLVEYARREGLENACRVILNLNEFSFVD
ncbi:MAG: DUF1553 domain-containing protein [Verrucomicrobiaceae bacterium]|nr:DUF1553 domain-containing protein [Verrucomicrobiaceae bacterium]